MADIAVTITQGTITVVQLDRGASGYSGKSGWSGTSGYSGANPGASGTSGKSGSSGKSGHSGASGVGTSGISGWSGYSGKSGYSGVSGGSGISGISGVLLAGVHVSSSATYISGTGTAGVDNVAQAVKSASLPANTLTQAGDRLRVRSYWTGDTGTAITGTTTLNGVTIAATTDSGAATLQITEAWLQYIDSTHANIIAMTDGALDSAISAANVAGFSWTAIQTVSISQNQIVNNHIIVFALIIDIYPKG